MAKLSELDVKVGDTVYSALNMYVIADIKTSVLGTRWWGVHQSSSEKLLLNPVHEGFTKLNGSLVPLRGVR